MPRLKPTRLEYVVDGERLRAQLTAAALDAIGDEVEQRRRALEVLRQALFRGRMIAKERLESGAGGVETARLTLDPKRLAYVHVARGSVRVNGVELAAGDAARLDGESSLQLDGGQGAEVLVFDLAR